MSKTILITGGAGAIGSQLAKRLCRDNNVLILDDLSSGYMDNIKDLPVKKWRGSIVDEEILEEVFAEKPQVIYHLAANFANQNSVDYPLKDLDVNGKGTLKLLQYARRVNIERFIYTSSSCVYGNMDRAISEQVREYSLDTPYAITKLLGEQYTNFTHHHHNLPTVIYRLFNSYGPGEYPGKYRNVIPNFMYRALTHQPLIITGDGNETRDFTYIDDVVTALLLAQTEEAAVGKTFNVGTGQETSIRYLAELIKAVTNSPSPIEHRPRRDWDSVTRRCADISLIRDTLGFQPTVDLEQGIQCTYEWFLEKNIAQQVY